MVAGIGIGVDVGFAILAAVIGIGADIGFAILGKSKRVKMGRLG